MSLAPKTLHEHQRKAISELRNGKILKGGVGTGKSLTALHYFFRSVCDGVPVGGSIEGDDPRSPRNPRDLYIITTAKKRDALDWEGEAAGLGLSTERGLSAGHIQVKVDSWNNIHNYSEVENAFFIFDEQRLVGSGAWVKAFHKIAKKNQWIVLSATPGDVWLDYSPIFIANGLYKNKTEFQREHVVYNTFGGFPRVDHYVNTGVLERHRKSLLVDMPYLRTTTRHVKNFFVEHDPRTMDTVLKSRWHVYEERPIRDVAELFSVMRKVVNSDPSRLAAVRELHKKHPRLIVFYNFNYELEELRKLAKDVEVAEWNGHKHEDVPVGDSWIYLVQYTAGAEGWNCITTDAEIFYSLNYSYKINEQAKGRIDRMNTPFADLYYYVFRSASRIDSLIAKSLAEKRDFNIGRFAAN